jgi:hypothetical protein
MSWQVMLCLFADGVELHTKRTRRGLREAFRCGIPEHGDGGEDKFAPVDHA